MTESSPAHTAFGRENKKRTAVRTNDLFTIQGVARPGTNIAQTARHRGKTAKSWLHSTTESPPVSYTVTLGNGGNSATFSTVGTLISGTGADTIEFTGVLSDASIDLGAGADIVTLGGSGNSATIANTETIPAAPVPTASRWHQR